MLINMILTSFYKSYYIKLLLIEKKHKANLNNQYHQKHFHLQRSKRMNSSLNITSSRIDI